MTADTHPGTYSLEAEQAVLGALLQDNNATSRIDVALDANHFHREDHRRIYRAITRLINNGKTADVISVFDAMEASGEAEQAGGLAYLGDLAYTASTANVRRYAEIVVERATLRSLLAVADEISAKVLEPGAAKAKVDFAQARVMALSDSADFGARDPQRVSAILDGYLDGLNGRWAGTVGRLKTGFDDLDRRLDGGMEEGQLIIVAGRPGMGKTTLAVQIAQHAASNGVTALVCSQEMPNIQLLDRAVASIGRVELGKVRKGGLTNEDHDRFASAVARLEAMPLYLDEQGALRIEDVRRKARKVAQKGGLGLLVIDYLQLMVGDDSETRNMEITRISGGLKALAKELRIPVIALSQLSRKCEERPNKRPVMSDLRESGAIEQDADLILAAYRDDVYNPDSLYKGLAELLVLKNRQGEPGGFVPLVFRGEFCRFDPLFGEWPRAEVVEMKPRRRGFDG